MRKLKFYLLGLIPGILLVVFILNQKGASCSGYLPSSRVVAESSSKKFTFKKEAEEALKQQSWTPEVFKDSIFKKGEILFDESKAQLKPCPEYTMVTPENAPKWKISFTKCEKEVSIQSVQKVK